MMSPVTFAASAMPANSRAPGTSQHRINASSDRTCYTERNSERNTMSPVRAQDIVRRAYLSVLNGEPDPESRGRGPRMLTGTLRAARQQKQTRARRAPGGADAPIAARSTAK